MPWYGTIFSIWNMTKHLVCVLTLCKVWSLRRPHWQEQSATGKAVKASSLQFPRWHLPLAPLVSVQVVTMVDWHPVRQAPMPQPLSLCLPLYLSPCSFSIFPSFNIILNILYLQKDWILRPMWNVCWSGGESEDSHGKHDRSKWQASMPQSLSSRVSQKTQKSEFCFATNPTGFHRLDEPPEKISAL